MSAPAEHVPPTDEVRCYDCSTADRRYRMTYLLTTQGREPFCEDCREEWA